ncbi:MAG: molybdopterin guanine dinucleotide-containing S/N-oxide reductase [Candidatus Puniceispirillaceae bacterium]
MGLTSTHWGTYQPKVEQGRVTDMLPFSEDGDPSDIGKGFVDVLDAPSRITAPMVRKGWLERKGLVPSGQRGSDSFVEVDWQTALDLVAGELGRVRDDYGNQAIFAGCYGWASAGRFHHAQSQIHRFLNCIGGYTKSVNTYSFAAAEVIVPHVLGDFRGFIYNQTSWESIISEGSLFVGFGGVPLKNGQINQGGTGRHIQKERLLEAKQAGIDFINISPLQEDILADIDAEWMAIRPNTDTALILGLCYVLLEEGLHNTDFLARHCTGFDKFADYLLGRTDKIAKTPDWAAQICGLSETAIIELARQMASRPTMISLSWSLTRQAYGEQPIWAGIVLAAMLGQIGLPGSGIGLGYSAVNRVGHNLERLPFAALPQGINGVKSFIPVARIADMLLQPGTPFEYNGSSYAYPDIKLVYWAGGNPFHHHQDLNRLVQAWQKPETVIVHEWCWNGLAKHADIVLPVTTPLERQDLGFAPLDNYMISMEAAISPVGAARDDYEIFSDLAEKFQVKQKFTEGRSSAQWQEWLYDVSRQRLAKPGFELPSYTDFRAAGWHKLPERQTPEILFEAFRKDPEKHPLKTPSGKIEIFSQTVAEFDYADCPGHPVWHAPAEWLGATDCPYPLHLLSNQPRTKLHSQLDQGAVSAAAKINGRETVTIHPLDAASRQISAGEIVRIFNGRGAILAGVIISDKIRQGVVLVPTGAWFDPDPNEPGLCKHGNPNVLAPDQPTSSLAQGPGAHSCMVEIAVMSGADLPEVTAHHPPEISKASPT